MAESNTAIDRIDHPTTAALAGQSLANSVAIAVSDATTALRNVQTIMTTVQSVAMARWLESGERDETFQHIVHAATQVTRDAVRLWQEVQATAQTVLGGAAQGVTESPTTNASPVAKRPASKLTKKGARKPGKATAAARKPAKQAPAKKAKAGKKAPARKATKPRAKPTPPVDIAGPVDES
jgi:hypothetical protein